MDHEGDVPPAFWSRPPATIRQRRRHFAPTLNPVAMIILVPILALLVIGFVLIPLLSSASQFLKTPNTLKKSWDSLNIVLVLFAVLFGVFLRQNNDDTSVSIAAETLNNPVENASSSSPSSSQWFEDFNDKKRYSNSPVRVPESGSGKMTRSSSSYPDLRQHEALWQSGERQYRFYDDFDLNIGHRMLPRTDDSNIKVIPVDTFVSRSPPAPGMSLAAPATSSESWPEAKAAQQPQKDSPRQQGKDDQPPQVLLQKPRQVKLKRRRSMRSSTKKENIRRPSEIKHLDKIETNRSPPSSPPPPEAPPPPPPPPHHREKKSEMLERKPRPPPPPPPPPPRHQEKSEMLERKKSGATKEIATAIASLYNRTKKKKQKIRNIYDNATTSPPPTNSSIPPPPPPPPPSVFHNMFRKEHKSKKIHSVSPLQSQAPPQSQAPSSIFNNIFKNNSKSKRFNSTSIPAPPPPPPPPLPKSSILNNLYKSATSKRFYSTSSSPSPPPLPPQRHSRSGKPPLPTKTNSYYENLGSQSPLMPIPPPPPPPPFKMRQVKFEARGDFVRIKRGHGSRSSSPELEDVEIASTRESPRAVNAGGSVFCPSPDVNTKADNFIARLKDEWRLEKLNSIRAKQ